MKMKIEGMDELNKMLTSLPAEFNKEASALVNRTSQNIRNHAVRSVMKPSSAGEVYEKYKPRRTHTASAPNNAPNTDTGYLASHIQAKMAGALSAYVDSDADYSVHLEFGTKNMAARPFMNPAVEQERDKFMKGLKALSDKAAK